MPEQRAVAAGANVLTDMVTAIHRTAESGEVVVETADGVRRLHFVDGELYLPADHPLAARLRPLIAAEDAGAAIELRALMARIAFLIASWSGGEVRLLPGATGDQELVGPLPTVLLCMEWAAAHPARVLDRLGAERSRVVAASQPAAAGPGGPAAGRLLDPRAAVLLARLAKPSTVSDLLRQSGDDKSVLLADLARLEAAGLVRVEPPAEDEVEVAEQAAAAIGRTVPPDVLRRFEERVSGDLAGRPLALDAGSHRSRVADLLARAGGWTAYELLAVPHDAREGQIHEAYVRLARLVHPEHAARLRLAGDGRPLRLLFEQATAAYLTLSQPDRRKRYDERMAIVPQIRLTPEQRQGEEERVARSYYERAEALIAAEDFHFAVELLKQAVQTHPRPEYYVLLGRVQAKNPNWLRHAVNSYRKALDLGADDPRVSVALGRLCEEMEQREEAERHYRAALAREPTDPEARAGLARVTEAGRKGGTLSALLGRGG